MLDVATPNSATVSNVISNSSFAIRFAIHSFEPLRQSFDPLPPAPDEAREHSADYAFVKSVAEMCASDANMLETMLADSDKDSVPFLRPGHKDHELFFRLLNQYKQAVTPQGVTEPTREGPTEGGRVPSGGPRSGSSPRGVAPSGGPPSRSPPRGGRPSGGPHRGGAPPSSSYGPPRGAPPNGSYGPPRGAPPNGSYVPPRGAPPNGSSYVPPRGAPPSGSYGPPRGAPPSGAPPRGGPPRRGAKGIPRGGVNGCPSEGSNGNWRCPQPCFNINFGHRTSCNRCKKPRPPL